MKKLKKWNKSLILVCILTLIVLLYWVWLLYMTQPATASNTYKQQKIIINVEVQLASHRGSDKIYILSDDCCFMLDTGWQNKDKSYKLAEDIISDKNLLTITVWEHLTRDLLSIYNSNLKVYQVIDLRSESNVYWNITNHNNYQKNEQVIGIITGIFLSFFATVLNYFVYCGMRRGTRKTRKK